MRDYFSGWYFKCQSDKQTLAVIPAVHKSKGKESCSIQLITEEGAWNIGVPFYKFHDPKHHFHILAGKNYFSKKGMKLCLDTPDCSATGTVRFGAFSPIRYDIMGPFRYVPFMECRHRILSMKHSVTGELCINGIKYCFSHGVGYIEGDCGYSFPKEYAWTQCSFPEGSLMLSVADIPFGRYHFTGIISIVHWRGKEYRLATYLGAKAVKLENGEIIIQQGDMRLSARLVEKHSHPLSAPINGAMSRTIHESASCRASYCFQKNSHTLFSFESSNASFEYEYLS